MSLLGEEKIKKIYKDSQCVFNDSKEFYQQAEDLLLKELGLKDFEVSRDLTYIVNYSDIEKAGRIDADYFQPKYLKMLSKIKNKNATFLKGVVQIVSDKFTPKLDSNYKYVELANINSS